MTFLKKLKNKSFQELSAALLYRFRRCIFILSKPIIDLLPINEKMIAFESEPDLSDNAYAFWHFATEKGILDGYRVIWFVDDKKKVPPKSNVIYVTKRNVQLTYPYYYLSRCKWFIYDHNNLMNYVKRKDKQFVFALMHGCGFKIGTPWKNNIDYATTLSPFWYDDVAMFEGCNTDQMVDLGYPRNDWLFVSYNNNLQIFIRDKKLRDFSKIALWMPTFRKSNNKNITEEYFISDTGLPILKSEEQLTIFDHFLFERNVLCIFKIHHLQASLSAYKKTYNNIIVLSDDEITRYGLQLYQVLPISDFLITDYSSISVDYLLLDKPMIFTLDDYEDYRNSRGFFFDNTKELLAGYHVYDEKEALR